MKWFFLTMKGTGARPFIKVLVRIVIVCGMVILPISAETGYTQGWMGAPDWLLARMDTSYLPDFYIPRNLTDGQEDIPTVASYITNGNNFLAGGSYAEANRAFESAITLSPNSFDAWIGRGYALEGLNRYQSAEESFNKAISLSQTREHAWAAYAGKGRVLAELQQYEGAASAYNTAIMLLVDTHTGITDDLVHLYVSLAQAEEKIGNIEGASAAIREAERLNGTVSSQNSKFSSLLQPGSSV